MMASKAVTFSQAPELTIPLSDPCRRTMDGEGLLVASDSDIFTHAEGASSMETESAPYTWVALASGRLQLAVHYGFRRLLRSRLLHTWLTPSRARQV